MLEPETLKKRIETAAANMFGVDAPQRQNKKQHTCHRLDMRIQPNREEYSAIRRKYRNIYLNRMKWKQSDISDQKLYV